MSEDRRNAQVATVRAMYEAFNRLDLDAALTYVDPDAEMRPAGTAKETGRAVYRGHQGIREYFADVARVWPGGVRVIPLDYRAVAGSVVVFGRVEAAGAEGEISDEVVWVWRLRDGLAVSGQVFSTRGAAMAAAERGA
jgi:ketosteroid isomerase-like protein